MRLKQFITEELNIGDPQDIIDILRKDCSDYIKYKPNNAYIYRGARLPRNTLIEKKIPRTNRKPKDTPEEVHEYLNKEFKKVFGWNVRSEGVFCTSNYEETYNYGNPYSMFPSNGFKVIYSGVVNDLLLYLENIAHVIIQSNGFSSTWHARENWEEKIKSINIKELYKQGGPKDIDKALYTGNEMVIKCKFYYLVAPHFVTNYGSKIFGS